MGSALGTEARDPAVFRDDDGSHYLVFGTFTYYVARLGADMVSLAEPPRAVLFLGNVTSQNGEGVLDDKPYLHKRGGVYYFSFGAFYATGSSPYGPFTQDPGAPTWVVEAFIAPDFRTNATPSGPCWCQAVDLNDRHGSFFSAGGQDFWSSNDRSHSGDPYNTNAYRDPILTYVHYFPNGTISPVVIDATGVGEYDGSTAHISAENYMYTEGAVKAHEERIGWHVILGGRGQLRYPHVRRAPARAALRLHAAGGLAVACALQVHLTHSRTGAHLARCTAQVGGVQGWHAAPCGEALEGLPAEGLTASLSWEEGCEGVRLEALELI